MTPELPGLCTAQQFHLSSTVDGPPCSSSSTVDSGEDDEERPARLLNQGCWDEAEQLTLPDLAALRQVSFLRRQQRHDRRLEALTLSEDLYQLRRAAPEHWGSQDVPPFLALNEGDPNRPNINPLQRTAIRELIRRRSRRCVDEHQRQQLLAQLQKTISWLGDIADVSNWPTLGNLMTTRPYGGRLVLRAVPDARQLRRLAVLRLDRHSVYTDYARELATAIEVIDIEARKAVGSPLPLPVDPVYQLEASNPLPQQLVFARSTRVVRIYTTCFTASPSSDSDSDNDSDDCELDTGDDSAASASSSGSDTWQTDGDQPALVEDEQPEDKEIVSSDDDSDNDSDNKVRHVMSLRFRQQVTHVSCTQYPLLRSAAVTVQDRGVFIWDELPDTRVRHLRASADCGLRAAVFGVHPEVLVGCSASSLYVLDARSPRASKESYNQLHCLSSFDPLVDHSADFCSLAKHPSDAAQVLTSNATAVSLWDVRQLRSPVLHCFHYLEHDAPRIDQVHFDAACRISTVLVEGVRTGAVHLLRYDDAARLLRPVVFAASPAALHSAEHSLDRPPPPSNRATRLKTTPYRPLRPMHGAMLLSPPQPDPATHLSNALLFRTCSTNLDLVVVPICPSEPVAACQHVATAARPSLPPDHSRHKAVAPITGPVVDRLFAAVFNAPPAPPASSDVQPATHHELLRHGKNSVQVDARHSLRSGSFINDAPPDDPALYVALGQQPLPPVRGDGVSIELTAAENELLAQLTERWQSGQDRPVGTRPVAAAMPKVISVGVSTPGDSARRPLRTPGDSLRRPLRTPAKSPFKSSSRLGF